MWTKNTAAAHSFLGLKIVPQIIEETNEKGKTLCVSRKSQKEDVVQPLPQRPTLDPSATFGQAPSRPLRRLRPTTSLPPEREAGLEILEILVSKANSGNLTSHYIGSPPCRAGNPLIHDPQFCRNRASPSPVTTPRNSASLYRGSNTTKSSPNSSSHGSKAIVRIEGFMPSSGEPRRRIPAFA